MDIILAAAVATVGIIEILKNIASLKRPKLWSLISAPIAAGMVCVVQFAPPIVLTIILVWCGSTLFYDTVLQTFKKLFTKGGSDVVAKPEG